jgi:hypothetical protein
MSEIWEECEREIEKLKKELPEEVTQDKDILDSVLQKKVGELKRGEIVGKPEIEDLKIKVMKYELPIKPTSKNLGIIVGIIAENENISKLYYETSLEKELRSISAFKEYEEFLYVPTWVLKNKTYVLCYRKEATKIIDNILKKFGYLNLKLQLAK